MGRMKRGVVQIHPFRLNVGVMVGNPRSCVEHLYKKYKMGECTSRITKTCEGAFLVDVNRGVYSLMFKGDKTVALDVVTHECFHVMLHVAELAGDPICSATSEAYAYCIGYFVNDVVQKLKELGVEVQFKKGS